MAKAAVGGLCAMAGECLPYSDHPLERPCDYHIPQDVVDRATPAIHKRLPTRGALIEELMEVACLDEESRIPQLEKCKKRNGKDYCRICVRKAVTSGPSSAEYEQGVHYILHRFNDVPEMWPAQGSPRSISH
ncbi:hypothetical protein BU23DRAFT_561165 [Bimuria novae-zelandiae CBS 107.79]|uniref:Uncharacterized protein n=1 Tax=Bimuria novae-zelandiae CBS 107.79 TaxID=1447943 RepID=A0A6A5UN46_9PLEO|nr:hypothetical protein BU23DRAFT_561165 [Bimuria novae-zelandiae CBS 107.79]